MKITKNDIAHSRNMLKAFGKGKWELDGMEILAFAEMMKWYSSLQVTMEKAAAEDEARAKEAEKQAAAISIIKTVEDPVKKIESAKKLKTEKK